MEEKVYLLERSRAALDAFTSSYKRYFAYTSADITSTFTVLLRRYIPSYKESVAFDPRVQ